MSIDRTVRADPGKLPPDWHRDKEYAEQIYERMDRLIAEGYPLRDVARRIGCSERAVNRYLLRKRTRPEPTVRKPVNAKVTPEQVREMRDWYAAGNCSQRELAAQFGLHPSSAQRILRGLAWVDV